MHTHTHTKLRRSLHLVTIAVIAAALSIVPASPLHALAKFQGWAQRGGARVSTAGSLSSTRVQQSCPGAVLTVYISGTSTVATTYADAAGTIPKPSPISTDATAYAFFYAAAGTYRIHQTGGGCASADYDGVVLWTASALPFLNVRDFGATGDGTTNDYAAFRAALDAMTLVGTYAQGRRLIVPFGTYRLSSTLHINRSIVLEGESGSGALNPVHPGSILHFDAGIPGIVVDTLASDPQSSGYGNGTVIRDLAIYSDYVSGAAGTQDGVWLRAPATIEHCWVSNFTRYGVRIEADVSGTPSTNANLWHVSNTSIHNNGSHGFYTAGGDANAGRADAVDSSSNGGYGFYDHSFLGNTYIACHTQANTLGGYKSDNATASNLFLNCYTEAPQVNSIRDPSMWIGSGLDIAAAFDAGTNALRIIGSLKVSPFRIQNAVGAITTTAYVGGSASVGQSVFGFGAADDGQDWSFRYGNLKAGWWSLDRGGAAAVLIAFSGSNAAEGGNKVWFPNETVFYGTAGAGPATGRYSGNGSPEAVVTANPGSTYLNRLGGAGTTLYVKESGTGNVGWIAK